MQGGPYDILSKAAFRLLIILLQVLVEIEQGLEDTISCVFMKRWSPVIVETGQQDGQQGKATKHECPVPLVEAWVHDVHVTAAHDSLAICTAVCQVQGSTGCRSHAW